MGKYRKRRSYLDWGVWLMNLVAKESLFSGNSPLCGIIISDIDSGMNEKYFESH